MFINVKLIFKHFTFYILHLKTKNYKLKTTN